MTELRLTAACKSHPAQLSAAAENICGGAVVCNVILFRFFKLACGDYCTLAGVEANRDSVISVEDNGGCRLGSGYRIIDVAALELDIIICLARDDLGADIGYLAVDGLHLCLGIALRVGVIRRIYDLVRVDIDIDAVRLELVDILCKTLGKGLAVNLYLRVLLDVDERIA